MRHIHWPQIHGPPGAEERERAGGEDFVSQLQGARIAGARWRRVGCWGNPRMVVFSHVTSLNWSQKQLQIMGVMGPF